MEDDKVLLSSGKKRKYNLDTGRSWPFSRAEMRQKSRLKKFKIIVTISRQKERALAPKDKSLKISADIDEFEKVIWTVTNFLIKEMWREMRKKIDGLVKKQTADYY